MLAKLRRVLVDLSDIAALDERSKKDKAAARTLLIEIIQEMEKEQGYPRRESGNIRDQRQ